MNSYGITLTSRKKSAFRSPYRTNDISVYFILPDGGVYVGTVYWGDTDSCGLIISPHLDYINDYYHYAHHATSDGKVGYVDGKNGNVEYSYGKLSGI